MSIILNNYNYALYVDNAIRSALAQTCWPVEVVVVDDGSTDTSRDVIATFGPAVVPIFKENGGQASALNAGFARCTGDVVIFLDADDVLLPETVRRVTEVFERDPSVAKVMYPMEVIDADGRPTGALKPSNPTTMRGGDVRRAVLAFPFDLSWMATSGNAFPRWVLDQIMPIPAHLFPRVGADYYLVHLAALFGPVVALDTIGAYYRVHGQNSFERMHARLNLVQVRQAAVFATHAEECIMATAERLDLPDRPASVDDMRSVSSIANRVASLKLDPAQHPIEGDTPLRLTRLGIAAALRRWDVSPLTRLLFVVWFCAMLVAPRCGAHWLAERFFVPETRPSLGRLGRRMRSHTRRRTQM